MMIGDSTRVMHTVSGIIDGCFDHIIHFSGPSEVVILLVNDILFLHDILNMQLLCRLRIEHVYYPFSQLGRQLNRTSTDKDGYPHGPSLTEPTNQPTSKVPSYQYRSQTLSSR